MSNPDSANPQAADANAGSDHEQLTKLLELPAEYIPLTLRERQSQQRDRINRLYRGYADRAGLIVLIEECVSQIEGARMRFQADDRAGVLLFATEAALLKVLPNLRKDQEDNATLLNSFRYDYSTDHERLHEQLLEEVALNAREWAKEIAQNADESVRN